jgi:WD40 repeat protein
MKLAGTQSATIDWTIDVSDTPECLALSGGHVVIGGVEGSVHLVEQASGTVAAHTAISGGLTHAALRPTGDRVALTGPFGAWLWTPHGNDLAPLVDRAWCSVARWATDRRLAVAAGRYVELFDESGTHVWTSEQFPSTVTDISWLGGRHRLAVAAYGGVHIVEPRAGGSSTFMPFTGSLLAICSSPNGRWIVSGNQDATLQVFRSDNDTRLEMQGYPSKISRVSFDSAGRFLANDGAPEVSVWDFGGAGPRGRAPVLLVSGHNESPDTIGAFAWHPSDAVTAVGWASGACSTYRILDGVPGKPLRPHSVLAELPAGISVLAWESDGRAIIVGDEDGGVSRLLLSTGVRS